MTNETKESIRDAIRFAFMVFVAFVIIRFVGVIMIALDPSPLIK